MSFRDPREVLSKHGLWTKKKFGQNFLIDQFVVEQIVNLSGSLKTDIAMEIGAGCGTLTQEIAAQVQRVITLEYDQDLIPVLHHELGHLNHVEIRCADVRKINWVKEAQLHHQALMLFGNLPYHLSSEIILSLIASMGAWRRACFMVQKEFGMRLAAPSGTRLSSALSVQLERYAKTELVFEVPPQSFVPPPKVDSCIIIIEPIEPSARVDVGSDKAFRHLVRTLYGQRRKMSRKALKGLNVDVERLLSLADLDGSRRGEDFDLEEIARLARCYQKFITADQKPSEDGN